jgi:polar amino acid transport system substrate-binding protein
VTSQDVSGLGSVSLFIQETLGLNLSFLYDQYDKDRYLRGIAYTLIMSVASSIGALILGYLGAKAVLGGSKTIRAAGAAVNFYGQMTPPLLQMYLLYFGLTSYIAATSGVMIPPIVIAIFCLSFYHGAMISQTFVQSITAMRAEHPEISLTLAKIPLILGQAGVGIKGALVNLVKASMIASAIAVPEILSSTVSIVEDQGNVHVMMILLLVFFYVMANSWLYLIELIERRVISMGAR